MGAGTMLLLFLRPGPTRREELGYRGMPRWGCDSLLGRAASALLPVAGVSSSSSMAGPPGPLEDEAVAVEAARFSAAVDASWSSSVSSESSESVSMARKGAAVDVAGAPVSGLRGVWSMGGGDGDGDGELRESRERVELAIAGDDEQGSFGGVVLCSGEDKQGINWCVRENHF